MPPDRLARYLAHRRPFEVGFWVLLFVVESSANVATAWLAAGRGAHGPAAWELMTWEFSSNLVWLALVPIILCMQQAWPLRWGVWRAHLRWHLAASLGLSLVHVLAMVALRQAVYALRGEHYDFGHWPTELLYEALKDVRTYALVLALAAGYRLVLWRLQGEASLLQPADDGPHAPPPAVALATEPAPATPDEPAPERFLVKKLGKEFLLPTAEIEWVQACGNYVNLHRRGHDYPLRSTLSAMEARLDARVFSRVHRSYLVNLGLIDAIEPTEAGDARLRMKDGAMVPCSRNHLDALRQRLR
jgi:hypothetical protein